MKPLKFTSKKEAGRSHYFVNRKLMEEALFALPPGRYDWTIEKHKRKASPKQFGWLYGSIYPLSWIALLDAGYEMKSIEDVDMFWKGLFANKEVLIKETGQLLTLPLSKSEFFTIDHMAYCSSIRTHCEDFLNAYIPEPDVNWKRHREKMQEEISKLDK